MDIDIKDIHEVQDICKMSNHACLIMSATAEWQIQPEVFSFNVLISGPEARPEWRSHVGPPPHWHMCMQIVSLQNNFSENMHCAFMLAG